jgi:hypothetical protein
MKTATKTNNNNLNKFMKITDLTMSQLDFDTIK